MDAEKCSVCGDDLMPDEASICWQCDLEIRPQRRPLMTMDIGPTVSQWERWLLVFGALAGWMLFSWLIAAGAW